MKGFNSIGDLSRFTVLRQGNAGLKTRIATLSKEATTGLKADIPAALGGQLSQLAQIHDRLSMLESHGRNAAGLQVELTGMQVAMDKMLESAVARGGELAGSVSSMDPTLQRVLTERATSDLKTAVAMLNTSLGGRHLWSGTDVGTPPIASAEDLLTAARGQVAGLSDPGAVAAKLDAWFAATDATGFAAQLTRGNDDHRSTGIGPDTDVTIDHSIRDPAIITFLKGLTMAAVAGDEAVSLSFSDRSEVLHRASQSLLGSRNGLTGLQADIGMRQQLVEDTVTRNASETTALSITRNDLIGADPFETASALTQAETNLQTLYSLTSRLARLSLTDYL